MKAEITEVNFNFLGTNNPLYAIIITSPNIIRFVTKEGKIRLAKSRKTAEEMLLGIENGTMPFEVTSNMIDESNSAKVADFLTKSES